MKILFLGDKNGVCLPTFLFLIGTEKYIIFTADNVDADEVKEISPDIIVSYQYRHILNPDVINIPPFGVVNLHHSYLPWNRGADSNFWSHLENTPKGVTIHYIDKGIDTGDIIVRKKVKFSEDDTLRTSYAKLHAMLEDLFKRHWSKIRVGKAPRKKQQGKGSFHLMKDRERFNYLLAGKGWDTPIKDIKK